MADAVVPTPIAPITNTCPSSGPRSIVSTCCNHSTASIKRFDCDSWVGARVGAGRRRTTSQGDSILEEHLLRVGEVAKAGISPFSLVINFAL
jgi:hypothetical protein